MPELSAPLADEQSAAEALASMIHGHAAAQIAGAAARLGIADHLTGKARTAAELAPLVGADRETMERFLRACAGLGLLKEDYPGRYIVTGLGSLLSSDSPFHSMTLAFTSPAMCRPWEHLADVVRTGQSQTTRSLGMKMWEYLAVHPDEGRQFAAAQSGITELTADALISMFDFSGYSLIVDVGGSYGTFLRHVLKVASAAEAVVFDLPEVVAQAKMLAAGSADCDRLSFAGGSFLEFVPAGGDLYLLKNVLCDWDDKQCIQILTNCYAAGSAGSTLLIIDWIRPERPDLQLSITDLALIETGGRIRSRAEFDDILSDSGYRLESVTTQAIAVPGGHMPWSIIKARHAAPRGSS